MSENVNKKNEEASKASAEKTSIADQILQQIAEKTGKKFDLDELKKTDSKQKKEQKKETVKKEEPKTIQKEENEEKKELEVVSGKKVETDNKPETKQDKKLEKEEDPKSETSEKTEQQKQEKKEETKATDFSVFSKAELVEKLESLLKEENVSDIKEDVDLIKQSFYKLHNTEIKKLKDEIDEKNKEIENEEEKLVFEAPQDEHEDKLKELLKKYKDDKAEYLAKLEKEKEANLAKKNAIIEKIKNLINKEEAFNETFNEFRALQQEWRDVGLVPQSAVKQLWENYNVSVENFYAYVKINKELRDLDLKKNLESKTEYCEQAEALLIDTDVVRAFRKLQDLHDLWRETGPVPQDKKEELWERFKRATTQINKNHQDHFEKLKEDQLNNLKAKTLICDKVDEINSLEIDKAKDWDEKSKEIIELQKIWRLIGFAPKKDNNEIYQRFRESCDKFFNRKRDFFAELKEEQNNNLQLKLDLCVQAESLKESTEWRKTTEEYKALQKRWKEIGPVPRKQSDIIWKRFRAACDFFFDKKSDFYKNIDTVQQDNLDKKLALIEKVKNFEPKESVEENIKELQAFQNEWTEIGHVPYEKKDEVIMAFRKEIDARFDSFNMDRRQRQNLKFKQKVEQLSTGGQGKMRAEREKLVHQLQKINNDITTLENNIGFFANTKNADSLIQDVKNKITNTKKKADEIKQKIKIIDNA